MKKIFSLLAFSFVALHAAGQRPNPPKDTMFYKDIVRTEFLWEEFNDDSREWIGVPDDTTVAIKDGLFHIYPTTTASWGIDIDIDYDRNFEIEISAKEESTKFGALGIFRWADECGISSAWIEFTPSYMHMQICQFDDCGKYKRTYKSGRRDTFNRIFVRKIADSYYLFMNDKYCFAYPAEKLYGKRIEFDQKKAHLMVDYIRISYLD